MNTRSNKYMFYAADKNGVGVVSGAWPSVGLPKLLLHEALHRVPNKGV